MLMLEESTMGVRASEKTAASCDVESGVGVADGTGLGDSDIWMGLLGMGLATGVVLISVIA